MPSPARTARHQTAAAGNGGPAPDPAGTGQPLPPLLRTAEAMPDLWPGYEWYREMACDG